MKFQVENCDVAIGGLIIRIIENTCYSETLGVSLMESEVRVVDKVLVENFNWKNKPLIKEKVNPVPLQCVSLNTAEKMAKLFLN